MAERCMGAYGVSAPGATSSSPAVPWHTPAHWHHSDPLPTAWRDQVTSASAVSAWQRGALAWVARLFVKNAPVDNFRSASNL